MGSVKLDYTKDGDAVCECSRRGKKSVWKDGTVVIRHIDRMVDDRYRMADFCLNGVSSKRVFEPGPESEHVRDLDADTVCDTCKETDVVYAAGKYGYPTKLLCLPCSPYKYGSEASFAAQEEAERVRDLPKRPIRKAKK